MADWMPEPDPAAIAAARALLEGARSVTVLTGAGISTDSGIPDFRGPNGLWTKNPKAERTAHIDHYVRDPEVRVLAWQGRLRWIELAPEPNAGHRALVELERRGVLHSLVTQNIDGLHQAAGHDPARVVEVHGTIHEVVCLACERREPAGPTLDRVRAGEADPRCLDCGGLLKSATISFGQGLRPEDLTRAFDAAEACDLLLAAGSTLSVYPVAGMVPHAKRAGATILIVNAEPTEMDPLADLVVHGSLSRILPELVGLDSRQT
ncbi:SIR2 family NAD-dependent protein deacylase [Rhabdothermincola sp.]|uniref:SIR2 family NAD-dependent protein deacylase n=1 Tax=Rhabdothermincola sp. TaxID=2820405 RepID=UPI002FE428B0